MTAFTHTEPQAFDLGAYLEGLRTWLEDAITSHITEGSVVPESLHEAMGYSLMAGGKRLRPILVAAGAEAVGGRRETVLEAAVALECIHTYSLIHDDLPAMDDDDLRRGKPTSHKVHGEAMAILAGDALLTRAFELLSCDALVERVGTQAALAVTRAVALASGAAGMVGGQVVDIEAEGATVDARYLQRLHALKTGALIRVAVESGGRLAGA
ncbi:MAG: polyprenyl synthetase family protein, partial [Myxococcota bacterium]|nr:polyprenyl synthetase family protein [Myxococcota bacterium]